MKSESPINIRTACIPYEVGMISHAQVQVIMNDNAKIQMESHTMLSGATVNERQGEKKEKRSYANSNDICFGWLAK